MTQFDLMPLVKFAPRPAQRGHAAQPGSGPAGERCGTCCHIRRGGGGRFFKCALARWTNSTRTDVRAKDAACARWAVAEPKS